MRIKNIRLILSFIFFGFFLLIIWASFSYIEIVAVAAGKVIPSNNIKSIQHLEGGIIKKINIKEGSFVKKEDVLIVFEDVSFKSEVDAIKSKINFLKIGILTYKSILNNKKPDYTD